MAEVFAEIGEPHETHCDFCSCNWETDKEPNQRSQATFTGINDTHENYFPLERKQSHFNVMALTSLGQQAQDQRFGSRGVAKICEVVKEQTDLNAKTIQRASTDLKKLYSMKRAMRIDDDRVL